MAGAKAAHDHVDRVGELHAEFLSATGAQEDKRQVRQHHASGEGRGKRLPQNGGEDQCADESADCRDRDKDKKPAHSDRHAGLQDQAVEPDERQTIIAAGRQTALAPQLHEYALAIGLLVEHLEATVDVLAVGRRIAEKQICAFHEHRDRRADQQVDEVDGVETGHRHYALERFRRVEVAARDFDAEIDQVAEEARSHACGLEMALHRPVGADAGAHEFVDLLHLDHVALETGHLGNRGHFSLAVRLSLKLYDELDRARDLAAYRSHRHRQAGHADHLLQSREGVARRVRVNRRHGAFVARVHGLQHVEGFLTATLADDDAVRPHAECILDQFALANFAFSLDIGWARFHARHVGLLELQLGGVLDRDQPLLLRDERGQRVEHRRLAGPGTAGNDGADARLDGRGEQFGHRRTQRADLDEPGEAERFLGEFADRYQRPVDADRTHRDVDARAIGQTCVTERVRFINATTDGRYDLVDDAQQMLFVFEAHRQRFKNAAPLDIDVFVAVDQNVADGGVLEQRLERTEAGHFVENFRNECGQFLRIERETLDEHILGDELLNMCADLVFRQLLQSRKVDLLDQPPVQAHLGVEQLFAVERIGYLLRCGRGRNRLDRRRGRGDRNDARERAFRLLLEGRRTRRREASRCETTCHRRSLTRFSQASA